MVEKEIKSYLTKGKHGKMFTNICNILHIVFLSSFSLFPPINYIDLYFR